MKKSLLVLFGPLVFACGSLSAQTYLTADFEAGMPAGWTASPATGAWVVPGVNSSGFTPPAHTVFCAINDDASQTSANPASTITTPVINLGAATTVYLKYDCFFGGLTYSSITEVAQLLYSIDGGVTYTVYGGLPTSTTAWTTNAINLTTQLAGQANVKIQWRYNDGTGWMYGAAIDNISVFVPPANDANLSVVTPAAGSPASFGIVASNISIGGTIQNAGTSPITSIAVKYNDGTSTFTDNIASINIASFTTYNFTHNIPYNIPSLGAHPIKVWIELAGDANHTNDTLGTIINGAMFIPNHHVTVEEGTGTWCGWCVRGMVFMDQANTNHPTDMELIAVHNGDPMVVTAYDAGMGTLIAGYPTIVVNRDILDDPSNIEAEYLSTIGNFGYADLTPTVTFNATTRVATVVVSAHFAVGLTGDYRLACAFTENQVHGTATTYDQHNYYTGGGSGPMAMPGYDFAVLPDPVPAAQMYYDYVARTIVGGFNGMAASLPATIPAGSTQSYTFTYTIPAGYNVANMKAKVLLIDNTQAAKHIMNSAGAAIPLGIETPSALNGVSIYPNPFNQSTNIDINLMSNENVTVELFDMTGKLVSSQNEGQLNAGQHTISVAAANLSEGMYFVKITAGTSVLTQKVAIAH
ncbi:MAG: T9SS type A sorting domain-containing protein [Bacteroidetes bacterium]|jgi:hypothetical protein|nr:T9SS type A sorting domain-containing protein [Bacteroidota bacterium]